MRRLRSAAAVALGVAAMAGLFVLLAYTLGPVFDDVLRPGWRLDTVSRVEPANPAVYFIAALAFLVLPVSAGGVVGALAAPDHRVRHAAVAGLLVTALGIAVGAVGPPWTLTIIGSAGYLIGIAALLIGSAALGGWLGQRIAVTTR